jgi:hypothetical protein
MSDNAPLSVEAEADIDETAGAAPAAAVAAADTGPKVDVDEANEAGEPEELPPGTERLSGSATLGGAAFRYRLQFPVKLTIKNGSGLVREEVTEVLTLHRLTAQDMDAMLNSGKDNMKVLVLRSARLPVTRANKMWEKMDGADIAALLHIANGFLLGNGRKTGR